MAQLIKHTAAAGDRAIVRWPAGPRPRDREPPAASPSAEMDELARMQALLVAKDAEIAELRTAAEQARTSGEEEGRLAMSLEIAEDRAAQLAVLEANFAESQQAFAGWLQGLEALSLSVAEAAIERMFGADDERQATVAALIGRQLVEIQAQSLIAIDVSRADFPDTSEVALLAASLGIAIERLAVAEDLAAGECRLRLRVGNIDIGIGEQWGAIRGLFAVLADTTTAP